MDEEKRQTPDSDSFSALLLMLVALSGEFPIEQVRRLSGSVSYADFVVKRLKREKLIRTYYRDGLRGLRRAVSLPQPIGRTGLAHCSPATP